MVSKAISGHSVDSEVRVVRVEVVIHPKEDGAIEKQVPISNRLLIGCSLHTKEYNIYLKIQCNQP